MGEKDFQNKKKKKIAQNVAMKNPGSIDST